MELIRKGFSNHRRACAAAVALAFAAPVLANPNGPSVVSGQATFQAAGKTLTVTNTPGAIIQWQGFSIAADELTRFLQQSPLSSVLNRVVGGNPSEILGRLQSNGRVFLVNPNGIVFGAGSQVDVAGFAASTLNLSNADFLSGRHVFSGTGAEGRIVNNGEIVTPAGGRVLLVAPQVENNGVIRAPSGEIVLAAGSTVRLVDANFPSIQVEVRADGKDLPLGNLANAAAGKVFAFVVKQSGTVSATSAVADGGRVVLKSAGDVQLAAGSRTEAAGASGGSVVVQALQAVSFAGRVDTRGLVGAGGSVKIETPASLAFSGTLDTRGASTGGTVAIEAREIVAFTGTIDAKGALAGGVAAVKVQEQLSFSGAIDVSSIAGKGGAAAVEAREIVAFTGTIDARGALGGGTARVEAREFLAFSGTIDASSATARGGGATLVAPALQVSWNGRIDVSGATGGGQAAVLADRAQVAGTVLARAEQSGDGGAVEVSGRRSLVFTGSVDTRAPNGRDGTLVIDPARIEVVAGSTGMPAALADGTWAANEDSGTQRVGATDLTNLLRTTSVVLQATDGIVVAGDAAIESSVAGRTLTLQAPSVVFQGSFRAVSASADLAIRATSAQVTQGARIELAGGKLDVTAQKASFEPAIAAQRPASAEGQQRAGTAVPPDVARLRAEIDAEIARDNARLADAMAQSCARAGAPRQGCTIGSPAKRFSFAG